MLKEGNFDGLLIRELIKDPHFQDSMNKTETDAWSLVLRNFLRNYKANNYFELVKNMQFTFCQLGCKMNVIIHYLHKI